ncbi:MAG: radical SAM protein [Candidatus Lokiarchaeota archaeon]|nr:radical SAM protein [Candidatus Lokiarchaeota archaeon]
MIKKILFIQPFSLVDEQLSDILLTWPIYLENYIKSKLPKLQFETLYLPIEQKRGNIKIKSYEKDQIELFENQMNDLVLNLKFSIDETTLICISCTFSSLFLPTKFIANFFNRYFYKSIIVLGGTHISACNEECQGKEFPIDYLIVGEGEIPLYNLIKRDPKKKAKPLLLKTELISNLNDLPILDFSNLSISKYIKQFSNLSISLSRGCPYNCHFCMEKTLSCLNKGAKRWRVFSPSRALIEVKNMINFGTKFSINEYGFIDSIFGMNRNWFNKFLDLYCFEDYCSNWIETRLDILNKDLIMKLYKKKFFCMYGLESLSPKILKIMNKTNNPRKYLEKFWEILDLHKKLENICAINIIISHPGETKKTIEDTFQGLEKIVLEDNIDKTYLNVRYYHHFPGTYIYNNPSEFNEKYGTKFYPISKNWWKSNDLKTQKIASICVKPSNTLSLRKSIEKFTENYLKINKLNLEKLKKTTTDNISSIQKALILKKTNNKIINMEKEYINFLDMNQIEAT